MSTTLTVSDDPKMLRETLCVAQAAINRAPGDRAAQHVARLGRLIAECDRHRPLGPDGKHGDRHTDTCGCEPTPAPLDPKMVRPGDTVTLVADGGRKVTAPVSERTLPDRTRGTWFLDVYSDGLDPVSFSRTHWTLTAHQPAPEPAYVPGVSGTATVEGKPNAAGVWIRSAGGHLWFATYEAVTASGNLAAVETVSDFVPDEPRPLPTRDEVWAAITVNGRLTSRDGSTLLANEKDAADRVLALLRGESR